jgi:hypothetical protein
MKNQIEQLITELKKENEDAIKMNEIRIDEEQLADAKYYEGKNDSFSFCIDKLEKILNLNIQCYKGLKQLQRYDCYVGSDSKYHRGGDFEYDKDNQGDWVKFDDIEAIINELSNDDENK